MGKCPECGNKIGKHMEDEWPECSCGWTQGNPECPNCGTSANTSRNSSDEIQCENCGFSEGDD